MTFWKNYEVWVLLILCWWSFEEPIQRLIPICVLAVAENGHETEQPSMLTFSKHCCLQFVRFVYTLEKTIVGTQDVAIGDAIRQVCWTLNPKGIQLGTNTRHFWKYETFSFTQAWFCKRPEIDLLTWIEELLLIIIELKLTVGESVTQARKTWACSQLSSTYHAQTTSQQKKRLPQQASRWKWINI